MLIVHQQCFVNMWRRLVVETPTPLPANLDSPNTRHTSNCTDFVLEHAKGHDLAAEFNWFYNGDEQTFRF